MSEGLDSLRITVSPQCVLYYVDPTWPDLVADEVAKVLDNPEELKRMGKRGTEAVWRRSNWPNQARRLLEFDQVLPG